MKRIIQIDKNSISAVVKEITRIVNEQGPQEITISKPKKGRSSNQNRYYWGVLIETLFELGWFFTPEEWHEFLKKTFNSKLYVINGQEVLVPQSTAKLSTADFEKYCERIRMWASAEADIYIPLPNEAE